MAAKSRAKSPNVVFMKGDFIRLKISDLIKIVLLLDKHKKSAKLSRRAKGAEYLVRVPAKSVNLVKEIVADDADLSSTTLGRRILAPPSPKPPTRGEATLAKASPPPGAPDECSGFPHGG